MQQRYMTYCLFNKNSYTTSPIKTLKTTITALSMLLWGKFEVARKQNLTFWFLTTLNEECI